MEAAARGGCALITGASRGIGAATGRALASDGWPVLLNYRQDVRGAESVAREIEREGGRALALPGDVMVTEAVEEMFDLAEERFGSVLVLVNNAGLRADGLAPRMGDEDWQVVIETNLSGAFRTTRRALRSMLRARFGRIVNVASIVGPRANAGQSNYAASKAGLIALTKTISAEVARRGITVNAVAPGLIETGFVDGVKPEVLDFVPARRMGTPEEVAACVRFLVSDAASYVTGTTLAVDGGLSA